MESASWDNAHTLSDTVFSRHLTGGDIEYNMPAVIGTGEVRNPVLIDNGSRQRFFLGIKVKCCFRNRGKGDMPWSFESGLGQLLPPQWNLIRLEYSIWVFECQR